MSERKRTRDEHRVVVPIGAAAGVEAAVTLDAVSLCDTRALIQGNSGAGKSWLLRKILEQASDRVQTIVLDCEGEYVTLRERCDMVLVGDDGELPLTVATARALGGKLVELGVSAIVDLSCLPKPVDMRQYVRDFLEGIMAAPKRHWHPMLVALDEAHKFCPEASREKNCAKDAVVTLMSQGRKRGFGGLLATQRLSKLDKDAAAECSNVFVGLTNVDVDQRRAGDMLGITTKPERVALRELSPGEFWAYGPALNFRGVERVRVGPVTTTHARAGERHTIGATPANARVLKAIEALAAEFKKQDADADPKDGAPADPRSNGARGVSETEAAARVAAALAERDRAHAAALKELRYELITLEGHAETARDTAAAVAEQAGRIAYRLDTPLAGLESPQPGDGSSPGFPGTGRPDATAGAADDPLPSRSTRRPSGSLSKKARMVERLKAAGPSGLSREALALTCGMSAHGGTFQKYFADYKRAGVFESANGHVRITPTHAGAPDPALPDGPAILEEWRAACGKGGKRRMFDALVAAWPSGLDRATWGDAADVAPEGGTFGAYARQLRKKGLVDETADGRVKAPDALMEFVRSGTPGA